MPPAVSCICVTEDRPTFMPWLAWNWARQTAAEDSELIVVDSSPQQDLTWLEELPQALRPRVRLLRAEPGTWVYAKRNQGLAAAQGRLVAWFDDDDWQHPSRLEVALEGQGAGKNAWVSPETWFVDLHTLLGAPYSHSKSHWVFNGCVVPREVCGTFPRLRKGSDTPWLGRVRRLLGATPRRVAYYEHCVTALLCHERNISNPRTCRKYSTTFEKWAEKIREPSPEVLKHRLNILRK